MRRYKSIYYVEERAFTLTELAIVLGIIGTIIGAIWSAASTVYTRNQAQKAAGQVLMIASGYKSLYNAHGVDVADGTDITCIGISNNIFPPDMLSDGQVCNGGIPNIFPYHPWGKTVSVSSNQARNGVVISYWNLTTAACFALATAEANNADIEESFVGPNGTSPNHIIYPPYGNGTPMTSTQISDFCSESNNNQVTFAYVVK